MSEVYFFVIIDKKDSEALVKVLKTIKKDPRFIKRTLDSIMDEE